MILVKNNYLIIAIVAVVLVLGYFGWTKLYGQPSYAPTQPATTTQTPAQNSGPAMELVASGIWLNHNIINKAE